MRRHVSKSILCAGDAGVTSRSGCHGDSGGPFVCQKPDGRWFLHGVVSWALPLVIQNMGIQYLQKSHIIDPGWTDIFGIKT